MRRPGPAPAIFLLMVLAIAYAVTQCHALPAHGQIIVITPMPRLTATVAMEPRAWLMAQRDYAAPVASNCVAPGPCEQ